MNPTLKQKMFLRAIGGTIAFKRAYVSITGSVKSALMLSQACWYQEHYHEPDGFWWKTYEAWYYETGLTRKELDRARKDCERFIQTELRGSPPRVFYKVDVEALKSALENLQFDADELCQIGKVKIVQKEQINCPKGTTLIREEDLREINKGKDFPKTAKTKSFSDEAKRFVASFRERHSWYPRKLDPKQTARELSAAEYLLASSSQEELFAIVQRVMSGFVGNRRKVAMVKDLWENLASLKAEYSETGGLTPEESARIAEISRNSTREKTEEELIADWNEYVAYCASVGKQPDESSKPECLKRSKMPQDVLEGIDPHASGVGL